MGAITNTLGNLVKPMFLGLLILVGLGLLSDDPRSGNLGASGFDCRGFTNNPELNRALCRLNPMRLWNTPIGELVPWAATPVESAEASQ